MTCAEVLVFNSELHADGGLYMHVDVRAGMRFLLLGDVTNVTESEIPAR